MHSLRKKTVSGVLWSTIERFSVQGVQFVIGIIMARLLTPDDFGLIGMLAIFIAISQSIVDSGFSNALIRKADRTETDNSTVFFFNIVVGIIMYGILFFAAPYIADFYHQPILLPITRFIAINLFLNSLVVVQRALLTIQIDFKTQAKASLFSAVISGVIGVILAYRDYGVWALAVQSVLNVLFNVIFLWIVSTWRPKCIFSWNSFRTLFSYGSKLLISGLLDTVYRNMYILIIGRKFSAVDLGYYTRADQLAQFPSSNLTGIMQRVSFPILSQMQNDDQRLAYVYRQYLKLSAFIIFPLMIGLAALARPFTLLVLTEKWIEVVPLLQILCIAFMWYPIHAINLNLLQVKGRSDLFLRLEIIKKTIGITILFITVPLGIKTMCLGIIIGSFVGLIINTYYTGRLIQIGFYKQMRDLFPTLLVSVIMGLMVSLCNHLPLTSGWHLILGTLFGLFLYIGLHLILKTEELKTVLSYLPIKNKLLWTIINK